MNITPSTPLTPSPVLFEVRFTEFHRAGRGYCFPCDGEGHVDMNALSDRARNNYLYARAMVGREIATPQVYPQSADGLTHYR
ncbi:hypothetical protein [Aquabacterium sp.]|uniref:hypothetical protein n=1 Tax=Aquabacterium sp. TaxID=1872578 RepID=UPI002B83E397|nr:hypothetical protein [Aquabacterium sp.]HSW06918.1 hypothetical protein [Aquabacterium sp.]